MTNGGKMNHNKAMRVIAVFLASAASSAIVSIAVGYVFVWITGAESLSFPHTLALGSFLLGIGKIAFGPFEDAYEEFKK